MEVAVWETPDGRRLYKAETSRHHVFFARHNYRTPTERKFREMGGSVLSLSNHAHRELHAAVEPPFKPNPDLMRNIYIYSRSTEYIDSYDLFRQIVNYVGNVATVGYQCEQNIHDASILHANLIQQAGFIEMGRLTRVEEVA